MTLAGPHCLATQNLSLTLVPLQTTAALHPDSRPDCNQATHSHHARGWATIRCSSTAGTCRSRACAHDMHTDTSTTTEPLDTGDITCTHDMRHNHADAAIVAFKHTRQLTAGSHTQCWAGRSTATPRSPGQSCLTPNTYNRTAAYSGAGVVQHWTRAAASTHSLLAR
jgi:hypothetical protein